VPWPRLTTREDVGGAGWWGQQPGGKVSRYNTHLCPHSFPAPGFVRLRRGRSGRFRSRNRFSVSCIRWARVIHVWRGLFVSLFILMDMTASEVAQMMERCTHPWGIIVVRASDPGGMRIPVSSVIIFSGLNRVRLGLGVNGVPLIFAIMIGT